MPKYLIAYRKTEDGEKPEWAVFTTESELAMEAHAVKERVEASRTSPSLCTGRCYGTTLQQADDGAGGQRWLA